MSLIHNKTYFKTSMAYLGVTAFSLVLMGVYYALDHGLRDTRMTLLFLPPLVLAALFFLLSFKREEPDSSWGMFFHMGYAAIWTYMVLSAIITMAEGTNSHLILFLIAGILLIVASFLVFLTGKLKKTSKA